MAIFHIYFKLTGCSVKASPSLLSASVGKAVMQHSHLNNLAPSWCACCQAQLSPIPCHQRSSVMLWNQDNLCQPLQWMRK